MTALIITVANVRYTASTITAKATAGETLTPMMPVYQVAADREYSKAANTSAVLAAAKGLCLNYAEDGVRFELVTGGTIVPGVTMVLGESYYVGASGLIMPVGDLSTGEFGRFLGIAITTTILDLNIGTGTPIARA